MEEKSLKQRVRDYAESEQFAKYKRKWIESCHHFFEDGYLFWTNPEWINARLNENNFVELYQYIIRKLEVEIKTNKRLTDKDREYLTKRLTENRYMFYKELSCMIRDYCIS